MYKCWKTWPNVVENGLNEYCFQQNTFIIVKNKTVAEDLRLLFGVSEISSSESIITCSAEYELREEDLSKKILRIDSYQRFRGLEAVVVIIYNPTSVNDHPNLPNHYTTMFSRAKCLTAVITTEYGTSMFKSNLNLPFPYHPMVPYRKRKVNVQSDESD